MVLKILTGYTTTGFKVKLQMRVHSTIFKLTSRWWGFTLGRPWWHGQALHCVHCLLNFSLSCVETSVCRTIWKSTLHKPKIKKCRNHCSIYYESSIGRTLCKSRCWGQEKLNQILKKQHTLYWFRRGKSSTPTLNTSQWKELHRNVWKETNPFLLQIGAKAKALEKTELTPCFQTNFPLLKFYCHLFKILYIMGEAFFFLKRVKLKLNLHKTLLSLSSRN